MVGPALYVWVDWSGLWSRIGAYPEKRLAKVRLASRILYAVEVRGCAAEQAAEALSLSEADATRLFAGMLKGFSAACDDQLSP